MSYIRTIKDAKIEELEENNFSASKEFNLLKLTIKASGFLWHQIRCIVTILYEIGCGNEKAELIDQLLDVELFPSRPQYKLANELPLCLFDCTFADGQLDWEFDRGTICSVIEILQKIWAEHQVKSANIRQMLEGLGGMINNKMDNGETSRENDAKGLDEFIRNGPTPKKYEQIATRPRCMGLLEIRDKINRKRKAEENIDCEEHSLEEIKNEDD